MDNPPKIRHKQFEYSGLLTGIYRGLLWSALPAFFLGYFLIGISFFFYYSAFLLFLGFGLRPFLEISGLYRWLDHTMVIIQEAKDKGYLEKRAAKIDREMRDKRYRGRRRKHSDLPKHW